MSSDSEEEENSITSESCVTDNSEMDTNYSDIEFVTADEYMQNFNDVSHLDNVHFCNENGDFIYQPSKLDEYNDCTYPDGYVKRQKVYVCLDCVKKNNKLSGVCHACATICHSGHNVHCVYTKRNFRCDCGNEKFGSDFKCQFYQTKDCFNMHNVYNDNFKGIYCICKQPYNENNPDEEIMIQCIICEDWYHQSHLDVDIPVTKAGVFDYDELICFMCVSKYSYFSKYQKYIMDFEKTIKSQAIGTRAKTDNEQKMMDHVADKEVVDHIGSEKALNYVGSDKFVHHVEGEKIVDHVAGEEVVNHVAGENIVDYVGSEKASEEEENVDLKDEAGEPDSECVIKDIPVQLPYKSIFFKLGWRDHLCLCNSCLRIYEYNKHMFLIDAEDAIFNENSEDDFLKSAVDSSVFSEEEYVKNNEIPKTSAGFSLDKRQPHNISKAAETGTVKKKDNEYTEMKDSFRNYLKQALLKKRIVKGTDVLNFFERYNSKKRPKYDSDNDNF